MITNLKLSIFLILISMLTWLTQVDAINRKCPCHSTSLCRPIRVGPRREVVAFSVYRGFWKYYNWTHLTTIALFEKQLPDIDPNLLCYAHSRQVRLISQVSFPVKQLSNQTHINEWIKDKVTMLKTKFLDGINFDIEQSIPLFSPEVDDLIKFVNQTTIAIHSAIPGSLVTFDASYWPRCSFGHCYNNVAISKIVDFVLTMNYDEAGSLVASANSPFLNTVYSVQAYKSAGAQLSKIVTIQPWYGYDYKCIGPLVNDVCFFFPDKQLYTKLAKVVNRMTQRVLGKRENRWELPNTDDSSKNSIQYGRIEALLHSNKTSAPKWSNTSASPYFNYKNSNVEIHQVWYDDPRSLYIKYNYAVKAGVRGIGMWTADFPDYVGFPKDSAAMWKCVDKVLSKT